MVYGAQAILVSWRPPTQPNGIISQYTVYSREEGSEAEPKKEKVPAYQMSFEASGLEMNKPYEFWVTASTNIGEGQQSKSVIAIPSDKVPAKIASFDDTFIATFKEDAKLPCLAVGSPTPNITWKVRITCSISRISFSEIQNSIPILFSCIRTPFRSTFDSNFWFFYFKSFEIQRISIE